MTNLPHSLRRNLLQRIAVVCCALVLIGSVRISFAQAPNPQDAPYVQTYRVAPADESRLQPFLKEFGVQQPVREFYDRSSQQWVVIAPRSVHERIAREFVATDAKAPALEGPRLAPQPLVSQSTQSLKTLNAQSLHQRLEQVLNRELAKVSGPLGQGTKIENRDGPAVTVWVNDATKETRIDGTPTQVKAWSGIVAALDTPTNNERVVVQEAAPTPKLREAVAILNGATTPAKTVQVPLPPQDDAAAGEESPQGPVRVDVVEGTNSLMLRGSPEDVERVMKIIEEIEEMERIAEPTIEVVMLKNIDSQALATLLVQVTTELSTRYGFGSIVAVPLVNPNAVLLVGLPTSVERAKGIIQRLDQPVPAGQMQFEVFRLRNAKAEDALPVVESLFTAEGEGENVVPGLGSRAQAFADARLNALVVRATPRDMQEIRTLINEIDAQASDKINEIRVFRLRNTVAADLDEVLQEAFTPTDAGNNAANLSRLLKMVTVDEEGREKLEAGVLTGSKVTAAPSANALIVTASPESMPLLANLINQLDQAPDAGVDLKIFSLENGDALALAETLEQLFAIGGDGGGDGEGGGDQPQSLSELRVEVDERTNSLLVAGTPEDLLVVEAVVKRLDLTNARDRLNRVYRLNNKSAEEIALALNDWLRAERDVQGTAPGTASPFQQIEREVVVVPEIASNSLIVSATPRYYDKIAEIIRDLDSQEPMVMVQVLIGEVELGDADEFGIELGLQDSVLFDRSLLSELELTETTTITQIGGNNTQVQQQVIQSANQAPGFNFGDAATPLGNSGSDRSLATAGAVGAQGLASFAMQRVNPDLGFGGLVLSASSNSVSTLLRALQESRHLEILSRPQIMALNNQEGTAFVGQDVPYITASTIDQVGLRTNTITFRLVGMSLTVIPRISPDGLVVLNVVAEKSELGSVADGVPISIAPNGDAINAPIIALTRATTTVSAASGQTVVLSGLLTKRDQALHRRVPLLADIPLLGSLFRFDSTATRRTELLIILTPHVVNNRFEAEMLKQVESARMNWCLSDVVSMHGPVGLRSQSDQMGEAESQLVYPEQVPTEEYMPAPEEAAPTNAVPLPPQEPVAPTNETSALKFPFAFGKSDTSTK